MCALAAPGVYQLNESGYQYLESIDVPAGQDDAALDGVLGCPEQCLTVVEET
jgi:ferredoxin